MPRRLRRVAFDRLARAKTGRLDAIELLLQELTCLKLPPIPYVPLRTWGPDTP